MINYDLDNFTLHISKLAALQLSQASDNTEIIFKRQCWKKVGQGFALFQTENHVTLPEMELLAEASKKLEYFVALSRQYSQSPPPALPPRAS